jgi:hypothetical protein
VNEGMGVIFHDLKLDLRETNPIFSLFIVL